VKKGQAQYEKSSCHKKKKKNANENARNKNEILEFGQFRILLPI